MDQLFLSDVIAGLSTNQKTLPCKYFYDAEGSALFEKICDCDDYYITRTEMQLLQEIAPELATLFDKKTALIEPGAGAVKKISLLLKQMQDLPLYVPIDISGKFLHEAVQGMQQEFPDLRVRPIVGDFTKEITIKQNPDIQRHMIFFPGSTFGNFDDRQGTEFLQNMRRLMGDNGGMIIGVDAIKPIDILERAYDDKQGITALFNKNLLVRINHELGGDFKITDFTHRAIFNEEKSRVEMHLCSDRIQNIKIANREFSFAKGETIHTENSYKYSLEKFEKTASQAGLQIKQYWQDSQKYFTIYYLSAC